jgi:DNA-binding CsgD family transcriptional regulator
MTFIEADQLSLLIGMIYDAATDPSLWSGTLEQVAHFVGGRTAALLSRDTASFTVEVHHDFGADSHFRQLYRDKYFGIDPFLTGQLAVTIDQAISVTDVMSYAVFLKTPFHREWVEPQGAVDIAAVVIEKSDTRTTLLSVMRDERHGVVDGAMRERMRLLAPHIRRSTLMGRQIEAGSCTATDLARTLDVLRTAICLLDADGRVVRANKACRQLFANADLLTTVGDRIVARNGEADRMLRGLLGKAEGDGAASGVHNQIESLRSADGSHYLVHALVLTRERRHPVEPAEFATSVLFVWKVSIMTSSASGVIASAFKLTPSELRVLTAIVEVGGVPEVAAALGIADTTVRTHLSRLFEKIGVSRQADLVKIVASFSAPFARHNDRE